MSPREELIELIEAYAAATKADNKLLKGFASKHLGGFLQSVDIVKPIDVPEEIQKQVKTQLPKAPARRTRKTKEA